MLPKEYPDENCSIARSLEVVGDRWTLLIVREALRGVERFDDFQASLGVARNILSDRLGRLCDEDILRRVPSEEHPLRQCYRPTPKGRALWPVLIALMNWGDGFYAPKGPPRIAIHQDCAGDVAGRLVCKTCGLDVDVSQLATRPGPGSKQRPGRL